MKIHQQRFVTGLQTCPSATGTSTCHCRCGPQSTDPRVLLMACSLPSSCDDSDSQHLLIIGAVRWPPACRKCVYKLLMYRCLMLYGRHTHTPGLIIVYSNYSCPLGPLPFVLRRRAGPGSSIVYVGHVRGALNDVTWQAQRVIQPCSQPTPPGQSCQKRC